MALHRWNACNPAHGRCFRPGARGGVFGTTFRGSESPLAALSESETGYRADHSTVFGASHDTFRRHRFLGVGGSGRSPLEFADPTWGAGVWTIRRVALEHFCIFPL